MSLFLQCLSAKQFVCVLESLPKVSAQYPDQLRTLMARKSIAGMPLIAALADRVTGLNDLPATDACLALDDPKHGLIHFSGKGRGESDLIEQIERMRGHGANAWLVLSGDRLPEHQLGQAPVRYLESVAALMIARKHHPDLLLGAALNPFKYCEEDGAAQYLKAQKKLLAGADFFTLQLGFDPDKQAEALHWMSKQSTPKPMLACVMAVSASRASFLKKVPGVVLSSGLEQLLDQEQILSTQQIHALGLERLALHILGLQLMGFAGVHLSGIHQTHDLLQLEQALLRWQAQISDLNTWQQAWDNLWRDSQGVPTKLQPDDHHWQLGQSKINASSKERLRYWTLHTTHQCLFTPTTPLGRSLGWAIKNSVWKKPKLASALHQLERSIKRPLVGCDTCGTCRLDQTLYVCPETCPKGLANGPCGGTQFNRCEFGDRECIHSVKYRIAKSVNQLPVLTQNLIPAVHESSRGTSSWPRWFNPND